jgi:hypothetical protein
MPVPEKEKIRAVVKEDVKFRPGPYRQWPEDHCNRNGFGSPQEALKSLCRERQVAENAQAQS